MPWSFQNLVFEKGASAWFKFWSLALLRMITNAQKGQQNVQNHVDYEILKSTIQNVLARPDKCAAGLKNSANTAIAKFDPSSPPSDLEKFGSLSLGTSVIARVGQQLGGGLTLSTLELETVNSSDPQTHDVRLIMEATKADGSYGGPTLSNRNNPYYFTIVTDPISKGIVSCNPTGGGAAASPNYLDVSTLCTPRTIGTVQLCALPSGSYKSPDELCVDQGYSRADMTCKGVTSSGYEYQGSLIANNIPDASFGVTDWHMTCIYGGGTYGSPSEIGCK